jgi:hypothetical protein
MVTLVRFEPTSPEFKVRMLVLHGTSRSLDSVHKEVFGIYLLYFAERALEGIHI